MGDNIHGELIDGIENILSNYGVSSMTANDMKKELISLAYKYREDGIIWAANGFQYELDARADALTGGRDEVR